MIKFIKKSSYLNTQQLIFQIIFSLSQNFKTNNTMIYSMNKIKNKT